MRTTLILFALGCALAAQTAPAAKLQFDAASIKPMEPHPTSMHWGIAGVGEKAGPMGGQTPGAGVNLAANLAMIVQVAWGLQANQIGGLPAWTQGPEGNYYIVATTDPPATHAQLQQMLQNLLADRFKLEVKVEDRSVPGFALEVDKGGLKLAPGDEKTRGIGNQPMAAFANSLKPNADGYSCDCGADYLPVVDKTGLAGNYNVQAALGHNYLAPTNPPGENYYHPDGMEPVTIDELLHSMAGLRLVHDKVTEPFLTVVHIEKPTAN